MDIRGELRYRSLYWYNDGLKKQRYGSDRELWRPLKKSIRFDKYNKDARNLLWPCLLWKRRGASRDGRLDRQRAIKSQGECSDGVFKIVQRI